MSLARMRIAVRLVAVAALAGLTAGCFQPMYAEHADGSPALRDKLATIDLPPVDKPNASREARVGIAIRNALAFKLYGNATGAPPLYKLVLRFTTTKSSLLVSTATGLPTTETYGIDAQYNLVELATNKSLLNGSTFPRLPRRRRPRRQRDRGKHRHAARGLFHCGDVILSRDSGAMRQHRTMVRNCAPENLEILGLPLARHPGMTT